MEINRFFFLLPRLRCLEETGDVGISHCQWNHRSLDSSDNPAMRNEKPFHVWLPEHETSSLLSADKDSELTLLLVWLVAHVWYLVALCRTHWWKAVKTPRVLAFLSSCGWSSVHSRGNAFATRGGGGVTYSEALMQRCKESSLVSPSLKMLSITNNNRKYI